MHRLLIDRAQVSSHFSDARQNVLWLVERVVCVCIDGARRRRRFLFVRILGWFSGRRRLRRGIGTFVIAVIGQAAISSCSACGRMAIELAVAQRIGVHRFVDFRQMLLVGAVVADLPIERSVGL